MDRPGGLRSRVTSFVIILPLNASNARNPPRRLCEFWQTCVIIVLPGCCRAQQGNTIFFASKS